ncbi:ethanolamine ammonia-lyase subunit EutB, partial [Klebsiella pneumoniae]|uniref:ethanolamine ammonia-lyase subunit EutB n=1 Tax=Klebsiella pneumoniae TaxID=573 RepID=UPI0025A2DCB8
LYGAGDAVIGINPASDSLPVLAQLNVMLDDIIQRFAIPTQSWRVVLDSVASMGDLEISTFAFWQKDKNYRWWTEDENGWG